MELEDYQIIVFDCEVFAHDWLVCFYDVETKNTTSIWNDNEELEEFIEQNNTALFVGFNSKFYDKYIVKAILGGASPEQVKQLNDWIIEGNLAWEFEFDEKLKYVPKDAFNEVDIKQDCAINVSLKSYEAHSGMSIEESDVSFDINRSLTKTERAETERYCKYDTYATACLLETRKEYLKNKLKLAEIGGLDPIEALQSTDSKLAAKILGATTPCSKKDERNYEFPSHGLNKNIIPKPLIEFFERMHDSKISDDDLFSSTLELEIASCPIVYAFGGLHGAKANYKTKATSTKLILNYDVASLYPSLMINFGFCSRSMSDSQRYKEIRDMRLKAKSEGDKATANALKNVLNKTYGAMLNEYNALYDPKNGRSVCITGQLLMTQLAMQLSTIKSLEIVQVNTDGICFEVNKSDYDQVLALNKAWEEETGLVLEEDNIEFIWQKDVNNYVLKKTDGSIKAKGGYLVRGISPVGAWSINNDAIVVADAIREYLLNGVDPEKFIKKNNNAQDFQLIAKISSKYSGGYQVVNGQKVAIQKCNRVFASTDESKGTLYKIHKQTNSAQKIAGLPEHCLIANAEMPKISEIDKSFYIALAKKRIGDFERSCMTTTTTKKTTTTKTAAKQLKNVGQKLSEARNLLSQKGLTKSGKNMQQAYKYYELEDIVPHQLQIFNDLGLLETFEIVRERIEVIDEEQGSKSALVAHLTIYNTDDMSDKLVFKQPVADIERILNREGKSVVNDIQLYGARITYYRRYMKLIALDICETDSTDSDKTSSKPKVFGASTTQTQAQTPAKQSPKTNAERKMIANTIANPDGAASEMQIKALKKSLTSITEKYGDKHSEVKKYTTELCRETNRLTKISKKRCEQAICEVGEMVERFEKESANE